uniref:Uncharacterized protein n=1 Tax=uncultured bacterium contig00102 TaxID=1181569 RepID=A0A806KJQ4_9BACT|nr:hypothetical protein [uncultured bacterium contig00102]
MGEPSGGVSVPTGETTGAQPASRHRQSSNGNNLFINMQPPE